MFSLFSKKSQPNASMIATAIWERLQLIDSAVRFGDFEKSRKYVEPHCTKFWCTSLTPMFSGPIARWRFDDLPDFEFEFGSDEILVSGQGDFDGFSVVNFVGKGSVSPYLLLLRKGKNLEGHSATPHAKALVIEAAKLPGFEVSKI